MKDDIKQFLLQEFLGAEADVQISDDRDLFEAEILDSMGTMMLINFLEEEYDVEVDPDDVTLANFGSVSAVVAMINRKKAE